MRNVTFAVFTTLCGLATASACSAADADTPAVICEPGATQHCVCQVGQGVQVCAEDGGGWEDCSCATGDGGWPDANTGSGGTGGGGASGNGGTGGASGSGGTDAGASGTGGLPGSCTPGDTQNCGNCGTATCDSSGSWGPCTAQGGCTPGDNDDCGNCGTRTCKSDCTWSSCGGEGICAPGSSQSCGSCGKTTCTSGCFFGPCECSGADQSCTYTQTLSPPQTGCSVLSCKECKRTCSGYKYCNSSSSYSCDYSNCTGPVGSCPWVCVPW